MLNKLVLSNFINDIIDYSQKWLVYIDMIFIIYVFKCIFSSCSAADLKIFVYLFFIIVLSTIFLIHYLKDLDNITVKKNKVEIPQEENKKD